MISPKFKTRNPKEYQMFKIQNSKYFLSFIFRKLEFVSLFELRHSNLNLLSQKGYFNINLIVLVTLALMLSFWLLATPKIDILKTVQDLPKLTVQKLTTPGSNDAQNSQINKKPVIDSAAAAKLSTKSVKNSQDLNLISKDLDTSTIDNLDSAIGQIETDVE